MTNMKKGDYVLATKWNDGSPFDQWCVGIYDGISPDGKRYYVHDANGNQIRLNGFRRCEKISKNRGEFILNFSGSLEISRKSLWWWKRCSMTKINTQKRINS
jgi:hypothetical protein